MDRKTLTDHRAFREREPRFQCRDLPRLDSEDAALYDDLRFDRLGGNLLLEQGRICRGALMDALEELRLLPDFFPERVWGDAV